MTQKNRTLKPPRREDPAKPKHSTGPRLPLLLLATGLVATASIGLAVNAQMDWLQVDVFSQPGMPKGIEFPPPQNFDRSDLNDLTTQGGFPYKRHLIEWPVPAYAVLGAAGLTLLAPALLPEKQARLRETLRILAVATLAASGFILTLTGTRWLSVQIEHWIAPGGPVILLLFPPYVNLAAGLSALTLGCFLLLHTHHKTRQTPTTPVPLRLAFAMAALSGIALLLIPLLPYTTQPTVYGPYPWHEPTFHDHARQQAETLVGQIGIKLEIVRRCLWAVLFISLAGTAASWSHNLFQAKGRLPATLEQIPLLNTIPLGLGMTFLVLAYAQIVRIDHIHVSYNFVMPLAYAGLTTLLPLHVKQVLLPYLRGLARSDPNKSPQEARNGPA